MTIKEAKAEAEKLYKLQPADLEKFLPIWHTPIQGTDYSKIPPILLLSRNYVKNCRNHYLIQNLEDKFDLLGNVIYYCSSIEVPWNQLARPLRLLARISVHEKGGFQNF